MHWLGILEVGFALSKIYMGVNPKMVGFPNNHGVFLLKMISTWGGDWGVPPFKETPIYTPHLENPKWPLFWYVLIGSCFLWRQNKWQMASIRYIYICICKHQLYTVVVVPSQRLWGSQQVFDVFLFINNNNNNNNNNNRRTCPPWIRNSLLPSVHSSPRLCNLELANVLIQTSRRHFG